MKERLQTILNLEKLTAAQLAALLNIQRSTLSNLMGGRNKPSYDFILAIMTKLPNLNTEWLLNGEGQPYKNPELNLQGLRHYNKTSIGQIDASTKPALYEDNMRNNDTTITQASESNSELNSELNLKPNSKSDTELKTEFKPESEIMDDRYSLFNNADTTNESEEDFPIDETPETFHPFPTLEQGELAKRAEMLQHIESKEVNAEEKPSEASDKSKFEEQTPPTPKKTNYKASPQIKRIIILYSDGTFESFEAHN